MTSETSPLTIDQIKLAWADKKPESWNTTHIQYLIYAIFDDRKVPQNFKFLMECFKKFITWRNKQADEYFPETGCETMYSKGFLHDVYDYFEESNPKDEDEKEAKDSLHNFLNDKLAQYGKPRMISSNELQGNGSGAMLKPQQSWKINMAIWVMKHPILSTSILCSSCVILGFALGFTGGVLYKKYY
jgi:hypothetical protein